MKTIECPQCKKKIEIKDNANRVKCQYCGSNIEIIRTEKELADAINKKEDTLVIEGDLTKKVLKIKATGKLAWAVAIGAITIAVISIIAAGPTAGTSTIVNALAAPTAVSILGAGATASAISISVAYGGVGVLNKLRKYDVVDKDENIIVLKIK